MFNGSRLFPHFLAWVLVLATTALAAPDAPSATPSAREVIETGSREVVAVLRDVTLSRSDKGREVSRLVEARIDFDTLGRLAMGPAWRELSEAQRPAFLDAFKRHVLAVCVKGTERYGGQDVVVAADEAQPRGDWLVRTRVMGQKAGVEREVARLDFRLRQQENRWQVIDLTIGGVSLAAGFRAQFQAIMKDGGPDRLLELLAQKNDQNGPGPKP